MLFEKDGKKMSVEDTSCTRLICIGINNYQDQTIKKLAYCVNDCHQVMRIFRNFNLCDYSSVLTDDGATLSNILAAIHQLPQPIEHIIFYFSGHGICINEASYLYTFDTKSYDVLKTGLPLTTVLTKLEDSNASKITVILDSCGIVSPQHINPNINIHHPNQICTFEDTATNKSIFTNQFLKKIVEEYRNNYRNNGLTKRYQNIRQGIESFLLNRGDLIFLLGESGIGKSHFLRQMKTTEDNVYYISLPKKISLTFEAIISLINGSISSELKLNKNSTDVDPEKHIRFIAQIKPYSLLLIDHIDHISSAALQKLIAFLKELPVQKILSSRKVMKCIPPYLIYQVPSLSKVEIDEALNIIGVRDLTTRSLCHLNSGGNYINLLKIISEKSVSLSKKRLTRSMKKAMYAIAVSGGFINQDIFEKTFCIKHDDIEQLKKLGVIILHDGFYFSHDSIYKPISNFEIKYFKKVACAYWRKEVKKTFFNKNAVQNYILTASSFLPPFNKRDASLYYSIIRTLGGRQNTYFLLLISKYLKLKKISIELREYLGNALVDIGQLNDAISLIKERTYDPKLKLSTLFAETQWWKGNFTNSIKLSSKLLALNPSNALKTNLFCTRGIGYFFLGNWDNATSDLTKVIKIGRKNSQKKALFLAYAVLATIQGLRGTDFENSVINFKHAVKIAKGSEKLSWLALVYGNIGEILWKAGFYEKAIEILEASSQLAYITDNKLVELEINRNLLHAYYRARNQKQIEMQLNKLEEIFNQKADSYVKMQIINTLVTHYIFIGKTDYQSYLDTALKITANNNEYLIYTKSNMALAKLISRNKSCALNLMEEALNLSNKGKNWLAIKQIMEDWDEVVTLHNINLSASKKVFPKWHRILEKELLPHLFHLSRLCKDLESI